MKAIKKLEWLLRRYSLFSRERDFIEEVTYWIKDARKSLIPKSSLDLATACVDVYEMNLGDDSRKIVERLREIIQDAYNNLSPKNHMRSK